MQLRGMDSWYSDIELIRWQNREDKTYNKGSQIDLSQLYIEEIILNNKNVLLNITHKYCK